MLATAILGHTVGVLNLLAAIFSICGEPSKRLTAVLVWCASLWAIPFMCSLRAAQNKMNTLEVMSKDNRSLGIRLLLVYQRLLRSKEEQYGAFRASRLIVSNAVYSYKILNGTNPSDPFKDISCKYTFTVKQAKRASVHILLVQDQGSEARKINYQFGKKAKAKPADLKSFPINPSGEGTGFAGLYYVEIKLPDEIRRRPSFDLVVTFTLERAHNTQKKYDAFVICPFLYAKKMHAFTINADFNELPEPLRPDIVGLRCYPYDGVRYMQARAANFKVPAEGKGWKETLRRCHTKAVYYLEIRRPTN